MNILITCCSKKVLLVKAFKTYLNNLQGLLIATDCDLNAPALYFADDFFLSPKMHESNFLDFMIMNCRKYNIKLLIPTSCNELEFYARNKCKFNKIGCDVMICSIETVDICQNKQKFINFCVNNEIPVPKTYNLCSAINTFPLFIKPIFGYGSKNTMRINSKNEMESLNINLSNYIIQDFIGDKEYTIDYVGDLQGNYIKCVPRERINIVNGESCVSKTFISDDIIKESIILGSTLKLVGHNTIQCFYNGNDVKFIEVNPRFGGASNLGIHSGLNSPKILIDLLYKLKLDDIDIKDDLLMLRYSTDIFGYVENGNFNQMSSFEKNKIYCVDIDGTICTENCEYENAKPILKIIKKINKLFDNGNKIILFTSRGYKSKIDYRKFTETQLSNWKVNYHELHFNKPFADYYIDNKAINVLDWV